MINKDKIDKLFKELNEKNFDNDEDREFFGLNESNYWIFCRKDKLSKEELEDVNSFKEYILNTPKEEIEEPNHVFKEYGDTYVMNDLYPCYILSINNKGLVAIHDKESEEELWHLEKDIVEYNPTYRDVLEQILRYFNQNIKK